MMMIVLIEKWRMQMWSARNHLNCNPSSDSVPPSAHPISRGTSKKQVQKRYCRTAAKTSTLQKAKFKNINLSQRLLRVKRLTVKFKTSWTNNWTAFRKSAKICTGFRFRKDIKKRSSWIGSKTWTSLCVPNRRSTSAKTSTKWLKLQTNIRIIKGCRSTKISCCSLRKTMTISFSIKTINHPPLKLIPKSPRGIYLRSVIKRLLLSRRL